jgi:hypothetical protein
MADLTIAVSEAAFQQLFNVLRDNFTFAHADSGDFGPFSAGYDVALHLEGGTVDLRADNTVSIKELDIKWDKLDFSLAFDIPELCVGGFCIIPTPFGCALHAPEICVFSDNPDVSITIPIDDFITSEISMVAALATRYFVDPTRPAGMNAWDAQDATPSLANQWQIFLDPQTLDVDVFDIADIVGDLLEDAVNAVIDNLLGWLPGWALAIIEGLLGSVIDLVRDILDIGDDIQEWISDLLNVSFGLMDLILTFVADYFATDNPLEIEDPFPMLPATANPNGAALPDLVPVKIPIRNLRVFNDDNEMVIEASVG